jgi:hypothetical protein
MKMVKESRKRERKIRNLRENKRNRDVMDNQ